MAGILIVDDIPAPGHLLVYSLTDQLSGTIDLDRSSGTAFTITVPEPGPA